MFVVIVEEGTEEFQEGGWVRAPNQECRIESANSQKTKDTNFLGDPLRLGKGTPLRLGKVWLIQLNSFQPSQN